ncbi:hypothetical protein ACLB2K_071506 [Fragaria x ananassa]
MEDGVEMDETDESGLRFSDEKYHDIVISAEDEDCLFEDAGKDSLEIMEDPGKNMTLLRFEDVKDIIFSNLAEEDKFYANYAFVVGFSRRCFKHDKAVINGVECVRRRAWCCSKQGYKDSAAKKKRKKVSRVLIFSVCPLKARGMGVAPTPFFVV